MDESTIWFVDENGRKKRFLCANRSTVGNLLLRVKLRYSYDHDVCQACRVVDATGRVLEIWDEETIANLVARSGSTTIRYA